MGSPLRAHTPAGCPACDPGALVGHAPTSRNSAPHTELPARHRVPPAPGECTHLAEASGEHPRWGVVALPPTWNMRTLSVVIPQDRPLQLIGQMSCLGRLSYIPFACPPRYCAKTAFAAENSSRDFVWNVIASHVTPQGNPQRRQQLRPGFRPQGETLLRRPALAVGHRRPRPEPRIPQVNAVELRALEPHDLPRAIRDLCQHVCRCCVDPEGFPPGFLFGRQRLVAASMALRPSPHRTAPPLPRRPGIPL